MEGTDRDTDLLLSAPLDELVLESQLRRALLRAGYRSLCEVLSSTDKDLNQRLGFAMADKTLDLKDSYERNPVALRKSLLRSSAPTSGFVERPALDVIKAVPKSKVVVEEDAPSKRNALDRLPNCVQSSELRVIEQRCKSAVNIVADHPEDAFLAEALSIVSADVPQLRRDVITIFQKGQAVSKTGSSIHAMRALFNEAPNAFLLYMLDSVVRNFNGNSVWRQAFDELGIRDNGSTTEIPKFVYERIKDLGFRSYDSQETEFQYYYTALLHAGLAETDWVSIWHDTIIPLSRALRRNQLPDGMYPTGEKLIELANEPDGRYYLSNASARRFVSKVPEITAPLLASALDVAASFSAWSPERGESLTISREQLPERAIEALETVLEGKKTSRSHVSRASAKVVSLPSAELRLNMADLESPLLLHWDASQLLASWLDDEDAEVVYAIDGKECLTNQIMQGVTGAVLMDAEIPARPERLLSVEVELRRSDVTSIGRLSSSQTFKESFPGVYVFVRGNDGVFRQKIRPLRKQRAIACLVAPGYELKPIAGIRHINSTVCAGGYEIQMYEMEPTGCVDIFDPAGVHVASWCEGFRISMNRRQVIGEKSDLTEVYPVVRDGDDEVEYNQALPAIIIEGLGGDLSRDSLDVVCLCDDKKVSITRNELRSRDGDTRVVCLRLDRSMIPRFVKKGVLRVTYKSTGQSVLTYRFAVVPIQKIVLEKMNLGPSNEVQATYGVYGSAGYFGIEYGQRRFCVSKDVPSQVQAPLASAALPLKVSAWGHSMTVAVFGAGIEVVGPRLPTMNDERLADRADLSELSRDQGLVTISATGSRNRRGVYLSLGYIPCLMRSSMPVASVDKINPFMPLPEADDDDSCTASDLTLRVSFVNGYLGASEQESGCDLTLATVLTGFGFGTCEVQSNPNGTELRISKPLSYDLMCEVTYIRNGVERLICDGLRLPAGSTSIVLPEKAVHAMARGYAIGVIFAVEDVFDDVDYSQGQRVVFARR